MALFEVIKLACNDVISYELESRNFGLVLYHVQNEVKNVKKNLYKTKKESLKKIVAENQHNLGKFERVKSIHIVVNGWECNFYASLVL